MADIDRLLRPRSIAVMGSVWARNVIEQCDRMGFSGEVWPVHPSHDEIGGVKVYRSLQDLPTPPDASFLGVNRNVTVKITQELSGMDAGGAICFASGWREAGAADLQDDLVKAAGTMPILGPNCYGTLNYLDGAAIWPDQHGGRRVERGVAIISQSSNIAINMTMQARGLPVGYVICLGNAAQLGLADLAEALLDDPRVTALGLYVEGIDNSVALADVAQQARSAGKGVVCVKAGKTAAGAAAAATHTAALTGTRAASSAFLRQAGIAEVSTLAEMIETLNVFHTHGPIGSTRFCSLSCSGGEATLVSDLTEASLLEFPVPSETQKKDLSDLLGSMVTISNPLDYHTYIWGDARRTQEVFQAMLADYDAGIFVIDPPRPDRCDPSSFEHALKAIEMAGKATGKPAFPVATLPENFDEELAIAMIDRGIVPLSGLETALTALAAATTPPGTEGWKPWAVKRHGVVETLSEAEAKGLLRDTCVVVPRGVTGTNLAEVAQHAADLTPPFALKGLGFAHKSEAGAIRLGVQSLASEAEMPGANGYLVEEMIEGGVAELLIGMQRDVVYGATATVGMGGVTAELLADTQTLVLPVTEDEVLAALDRLRLGALLTGYRGRPKADRLAAVQVVMQLQDLMAEKPEIAEIEINPLILREKGAVAADALIRKEAP